MTSGSKQQKLEIIQQLRTTDADTLMMHEGVFVDDPKCYTREWFSWANAMFCELVLSYCGYEVNWVGFYLRKEDTLYLGPFQGEVACVEIPKDRGVCGSALTRSETILVKNVHDFPGHIACDSTTNSEIVVPIKFAGEVVAVLDLDSREFERFDMEDQKGLEKVVKVIEKHWKSIF